MDEGQCNELEYVGPDIWVKLPLFRKMALSICKIINDVTI